jgi:isopenicillin N synthase-like dioxygenase
MGSITESVAATSALPTIDISEFLSPQATDKARQEVIDAVSDACHTYGFFNLKGHGISTSELAKAFDANKAFFALSDEEKREVEIGKSVGRSFRGYEPPGIQVHHEGLMPDTKEVRLLSKTRCAVI